MVIPVVFFFQAAGVASDELEQIRKAIQEKGARWTAGESWVTRLSPEERRRLCGTILGPADSSKAALLSISLIDELPSELDWRDHDGNWVTPVKDQGACGSCWDFSAVAQVESWWKIHNDDYFMIDLSEQFVLSCSGAGSCDGGYEEDALDFIQSTGIPSENCFPYSADDQISCDSACPYWAAQVVTIPGWGYVTLEEAIIENIKSGVFRHPVSASYIVYTDFLLSYESGVYEHVWGEAEGGHAVLLVGWSDADSCWICENSWDTTWGEDGYFRIKYGECDIGKYVPFIWDEVTDGPALAVSPEQLDFSLTVGDSAHATITFSNTGSDVLEFACMDYRLQGAVAFHPDTFMAWDGFSWWNGDSEIGGYDNHWLQYLNTPVLDLSQTVSPKLEWMGYWAIEEPSNPVPPYDGWDGCNVWVSVDGGSSFQVADPTSPSYNCQSLWSFGHPIEGWDMGVGIAGWGGSSGEWTPVEFDLSSYKSDSVIIRFAFASDQGLCTVDDPDLTGFFIDDIQVVDGSTVLFENNGTAIGDMQATSEGGEIRGIEWLQISNGVGMIDPSESALVEVSVKTEGLELGQYEGFLTITSNDTSQALIEIPVHLEVLSSTEVPTDGTDEIPRDWSLSQNYPNPFNATTIIQYGLPEPAEVTLTIYDFLGRRVKTLVDGVQESGHHRITWDGLDFRGDQVSSGLYLVRMQSKHSTRCKKILFLK